MIEFSKKKYMIEVGTNLTEILQGLSNDCDVAQNIERVIRAVTDAENQCPHKWSEPFTMKDGKAYVDSWNMQRCLKCNLIRRIK